MTKEEKLQLARELYELNIILNAVNEELSRKIEKSRRTDGRCVECGHDLTTKELEEGDTCDKCYSTLLRDRRELRPSDELDFYRKR
jgi:rRNA maturation endonuclease Nob1